MRIDEILKKLHCSFSILLFTCHVLVLKLWFLYPFKFCKRVACICWVFVQSTVGGESLMNWIISGANTSTYICVFCICICLYLLGICTIQCWRESLMNWIISGANTSMSGVILAISLPTTVLLRSWWTRKLSEAVKDILFPGRKVFSKLITVNSVGRQTALITYSIWLASQILGSIESPQRIFNLHCEEEENGPKKHTLC